MIGKILREPLLFFLLFGGALFALFHLVSDDEFGGTERLEEIVVTEGRLQALVLGFEKVWQRPPTQIELDNLVEGFIREEVLYREALALGLERDDPIVRRRMRQKIEFLSEDLVGLEEPKDATLQAYLAANQETYRQPSRYSFRQVYLNANERGQSAAADAIEILTQLKAQDTDVDSIGDSIMIPRQFDLATENEIQRVMGQQFLESLQEISVHSWQGPIASGYGLHLVHIDEKIDGEAPGLDQVREAVFRDWSSEKRKETNEAFYQALRKRYKVSVEDTNKEISARKLSMTKETN